MILKLLATITLIAILAVLTLSVVKPVLEKSKAAKCVHNLKELSVATQQYTMDHNGIYPFFHGTPVNGNASWSLDGGWYWHVAPYVNVPRSSTVKIQLGEDGKMINSPNVFTCPSHGKNEPYPIHFPTTRPVSYAPSVSLKGVMKPTLNNEEKLIVGFRLLDVVQPSKKVWLMDSTNPEYLNTGANNWDPDRAKGNSDCVASFTRHAGFGNMLFFDGHVEPIRYLSIYNENLQQTLDNYFAPGFFVK